MGVLDTTWTDETTSDAINWSGGNGTFFAQGEFDGGTAKLQWSLDESTWTDYPSGSLTANGFKRIAIGPCKLRIVLSDSGSSSGTPDLNVRLVEDPFNK